MCVTVCMYVCACARVCVVIPPVRGVALGTCADLVKSGTILTGAIARRTEIAKKVELALQACDDVGAASRDRR